jgi:hypothetical protein
MTQVVDFNNMTEEEMEEWGDEGWITPDQLGKHCNECEHADWSSNPGDTELSWECKKGMPFDPKADVNDDHGHLLCDGPRVHAEIYEEAMKQCSEFEIDQDQFWQTQMFFFFASGN